MYICASWCNSTIIEISWNSKELHPCDNLSCPLLTIVLYLSSSFDDSLSASRRRKERSKRSHRKSPVSGRRQHKYRYRDETSHSSSRRRQRDRPKDERDSGRNNRQSQAKVKTFHFPPFSNQNKQRANHNNEMS